jgi:hypothetical protein
MITYTHAAAQLADPQGGCDRLTIHDAYYTALRHTLDRGSCCLYYAYIDTL